MNSKFCIIVGGSGGIGSALAARLKHADWSMLLVARDLSRLERSAKELGLVERSTRIFHRGLKLSKRAAQMGGLVVICDLAGKLFYDFRSKS